MARPGLISALVVLLACRSVSVEFHPYRACLIDRGRESFRTGTVVEKREDGALRFRFDDRAWGDHGFMWVEEGDPQRVIRRCAASDSFRMDQ